MERMAPPSMGIIGVHEFHGQPRYRCGSRSVAGL